MKLRRMAKVDSKLRQFNKGVHKETQLVYVIECDKDSSPIDSEITLGYVKNLNNGKIMALWTNGKEVFIRDI
jgi:hypothetical protein